MIVVVGLAVVAAAASFFATTIWRPAVTFHYDHAEFPIDEHVLSLSRASSKYSLPWLFQHAEASITPSLPILPPDLDWLSSQRRLPHEDVEGVTRPIQQLMRKSRQLFKALDETNSILGDSFRARAGVETAPETLHSLSIFGAYLSRHQTTDFDSTLNDTATSLRGWMDRNVQVRQEISDFDQLLSSLETTLQTAIRTTLQGISACTAQQSIRTSTQCFQDARPILLFLKYISTWQSFLQLNIYVASQRFSATTFFLNQTLSELEAFQHQTACTSRDCTAEYLQALSRLLLQGKTSELITSASRAGLLASKFWARSQDIHRKHLERGFNIWLRIFLSNDHLERGNIHAAYWRLAAIEWVKDIIFSPQPSWFKTAYEPPFHDWDRETPLRPRRAARDHFHDADADADKTSDERVRHDHRESMYEEKLQHFTAPLSARGFRTNQPWKQYKPLLNGERCVHVELVWELRRLRMNTAPLAPSWPIAESTNNTGSAAHSFADEYVAAWKSFARLSGQDDLGSVFCVDVPWEDWQLGGGRQAEDLDRSGQDEWANVQTIELELNPRERYVLDWYRAKGKE